MTDQGSNPAASSTGNPTKFCFACGANIDARAEICPKCGVRQTQQTQTTDGGKDRATAIAFALILGGLGIHKFYLGKIAQGVIYLVFSWTGIPSLIGWIEGIMYLRTSDADWAAIYGGPIRTPGSGTIGCLWALALLPLVLFLIAGFAIVSLIFLGGQVSQILSNVGSSV